MLTLAKGLENVLFLFFFFLLLSLLIRFFEVTFWFSSQRARRQGGSMLLVCRASQTLHDERHTSLEVPTAPCRLEVCLTSQLLPVTLLLQQAKCTTSACGTAAEYWPSAIASAITMVQRSRLKILPMQDLRRPCTGQTETSWRCCLLRRRLQTCPSPVGRSCSPLRTRPWLSPLPSGWPARFPSAGRGRRSHL